MRIAIQLAFVLLQRRCEVLGMAKSELDLDQGLWTIPAERMKGKRTHVVPLSRWAIELIESAMEHAEARNSPYVFPDYAAPVIVQDEGGARMMRDMRWGMPSPKNVVYEAAAKRADKLRAKGQDVDFNELLRVEPDKGVTNVRNTSSSHWRPWLGRSNRCLVPLTSFSEPDQVGGSLQSIWFALSADRPLAFFAGVWTAWSCVRKIKTGWEDCEVFGILTTSANAEVAAYHSKAMPVILTRQEECERWLSDAPWSELQDLQRPLPDGSLEVVARGVKEDETAPA